MKRSSEIARRSGRTRRNGQSGRAARRSIGRVTQGNATGLWTLRRRWLRGRAGDVTFFLHIPKTAGTSVVACLRARARGRWRVRMNGAEEAGLLETIPRERWAGVGLVEGHLPWEVVDLVAGLVPRPVRIVTMLRDPIERVLSFYSYVCATEGHHLRDLYGEAPPPLREFLTLESSREGDNGMVRLLAGGDAMDAPLGGVTGAMLERAMANLDRCAAVGLAERFEESLERFGAALGWPQGSTGRFAAMRANVTRGRVRRETVDERTMEVMRARVEMDRRLYERAMERFS